MNIDEFEARISQIIADTGIQGATRTNGPCAFDVTARVEKFDALEQELNTAISRSDRPEVLQEFLKMFSSIRGSLSDPNFLKATSSEEEDRTITTANL